HCSGARTEFLCPAIVFGQDLATKFPIPGFAKRRETALSTSSVRVHFQAAHVFRRKLRMRIMLAMAMCGIVGACCGTSAKAVCTGTWVSAFGARGDGQPDDTPAIQSAIGAAAGGGGGSVVFGVARYFTAGTIQVPAGVVLCGSVEGPFDVGGSNPGTTTIAPTLLVTNSSGPFITLQGIGSGGFDLLFHYPKHVEGTASNTHFYPFHVRAA